MESTPLYVTEKEAARLTSYAVQTLRNHRSLGTGIPYSKLGKSIRYKLQDVVSYMDGHRVTPEAAER